MKLYRNAVTITMFFSFFLLWMALFNDASENIQDLAGTHITQQLQQDDIFIEKFTNEEIAILATMDENELHEIIQALHKERIKSTLAQPTMSNGQENEKEDCCPICLEEWSVCKTQIKTACLHIYCGNCFLENFCKRNKKNCSMCREVISAYHTIVESNDLNFIEKLILLYPEILNENENNGDSFLGIVKEKNKQNILDFITPYIENAPILHDAVVSGNYERVQAVLQTEYVNPNVTPHGKNLPLSIALNNNNQDIAKLLIENGIHLNQENPSGDTPLFEAVGNSHLENIKFLLNFGADPNIPEYDADHALTGVLLPIWNAQTVEIAQLLIHHGAKFRDRLDEDGETILTSASDAGNKDLVEFYINQGLNVNHLDDNGTPLTHAIDGNYIDVAEILLKHGADPNIGHENYTLLQLSIIAKKKRLMKALLSHGANPFMKNSVGQNSLDVAQNTGYFLGTKILKDYVYGLPVKRKREENE